MFNGCIFESCRERDSNTTPSRLLAAQHVERLCLVEFHCLFESRRTDEWATSKPGEVPARAVAREITVTATIDAIDKKAQTVTIKGPEGNAETIKVKNPKNLEGVKAGDLVDITYAQALAVALDKPAPKSTK
jgi:hypothetical protein